MIPQLQHCGFFWKCCQKIDIGDFGNLTLCVAMSISDVRSSRDLHMPHNSLLDKHTNSWPHSLQRVIVYSLRNGHGYNVQECHIKNIVCFCCIWQRNCTVLVEIPLASCITHRIVWLSVHHDLYTDMQTLANTYQLNGKSLTNEQHTDLPKHNT